MTTATLDLVQAGSASMDRRREYADLLLARPDLREAELELCRQSVVHWVNTWCYTCDPRDNRVYPFDLWPKQVAFLEWLGEMERRRLRGLCKKARDGGFSYLCAAYAVHGWLFRRFHTVGFGSRDLGYADTLGDLKSCLEKCRFLLYGLPGWMLPRDYNQVKDDNHRKILNRTAGNAIIAEGGDNIGRGNRTSIYFVDEAAFLEHPEMAERALSATTNVRVDISSVNGPATVFAVNCRRSPADQVFVSDWQDDPRKDAAWAANKKEEIGEVNFAAEYEGDESASVEGIVIPARWVRAAVNLVLPPPDGLWNASQPDKEQCPDCWGTGRDQRESCEGDCPVCNGTGLVPRKAGVQRWQGRSVCAGFDVAEEGKDLCVVLVREGPVVLPEWITSWGKLNTTQSAWKARDWLDDWSLTHLELADPDGLLRPRGNGQAVLATVEFKDKLVCNYDAGGAGCGIKGTWNSSEEPLLFDVVPLLAGASPSEDVWPDGKTSKEKFANLRAEGWWKLRRRFEKTYEWVMHQREPDNPKYSRGGQHPLDELISIPDHPQLLADLSLLTFERTATGKIKIQSKSEVTKSPDFGDACWQAFYDGPRKLEASIA